MLRNYLSQGGKEKMLHNHLFTCGKAGRKDDVQLSSVIRQGKLVSLGGDVTR